MKPSDLSVFVYGTLKPGGRYWPEFCAGKVDEPLPAMIRGELYDLHLGYPGLRLAESCTTQPSQNEVSPTARSHPGRSRSLPEGKWVRGYVLTFKTKAGFLRLDGLEGYAADRPYLENEYIRLKVPTFSIEGAALGEVWTYEITEHTLTRCQGTPIPGGDWPV